MGVGVEGLTHWARLSAAILFVPFACADAPTFDADAETENASGEGAEHDAGNEHDNGSSGGVPPLAFSCDLGMNVVVDARSWSGRYFLGDLDGDGEPDAINVNADVILSSTPSSSLSSLQVGGARVVDVADWTGNEKDDVIVHSAELGWLRVEITDDGELSSNPWLPDLAQELPTGGVVLPILHDFQRTLLFCERRGEVRNRCLIVRGAHTASPSLVPIELDPGDSSLSGSAELLAAGDMNGDGHGDIAVLYFGPTYPAVEYVVVYRGPELESGSRFSVRHLPPRSELLEMVLEDVDQDGIGDLIMSFGTNLKTEGSMWKIMGSKDVLEHAQGAAEVFEHGFARFLDIDHGLMSCVGHFDVAQDGQQQLSTLLRLAGSDGFVKREFCTEGCFGQLGSVKIWTSPLSNASIVFCLSWEQGLARSIPFKFE